MKRAEAHSAVQPRRSAAHTRRLAIFLADRKNVFQANWDWNLVPRRVPQTVETDTVTVLVTSSAWQRVELASSVTEAIEENRCCISPASGFAAHGPSKYWDGHACPHWRGRAPRGRADPRMRQCFWKAPIPYRSTE